MSWDDASAPGPRRARNGESRRERGNSLVSGLMSGGLEVGEALARAQSPVGDRRGMGSWGAGGV